MKKTTIALFMLPFIVLCAGLFFSSYTPPQVSSKHSVTSQDDKKKKVQTLTRTLSAAQIANANHIHFLPTSHKDSWFSITVEFNEQDNIVITQKISDDDRKQFDINRASIDINNGSINIQQETPADTSHHVLILSISLPRRNWTIDVDDSLGGFVKLINAGEAVDLTLISRDIGKITGHFNHLVLWQRRDSDSHYVSDLEISDATIRHFSYYSTKLRLTLGKGVVMDALDLHCDKDGEFTLEETVTVLGANMTWQPLTAAQRARLLKHSPLQPSQTAEDKP